MTSICLPQTWDLCERGLGVVERGVRDSSQRSSCVDPTRCRYYFITSAMQDIFGTSGWTACVYMLVVQFCTHSKIRTVIYMASIS